MTYYANSIHDYIIGIDPDVTASGVAVINTKARTLSVCTLAFPMLLVYLKGFRGDFYDRYKVVVVVEASHLIKSNWHLPRVCSANKAAAMGEAVGRCHEVGILIAEMARSYHLDVVEQPPLRKCWSGKDGKITHEELKYIVEREGYTLPSRTNQEERDALLLAWNAARLPIRVKAMGRKVKP